MQIKEKKENEQKNSKKLYFQLIILLIGLIGHNIFLQTSFEKAIDAADNSRKATNVVFNENKKYKNVKRGLYYGNNRSLV